MDMFGFLMYLPILLLIALMVIGYSQMQVGLGFQIIHGDGHLFTMVAGYMTLIMDGYGFLVTNGVRLGSPGEDPKVIMAGRQ